MTFSRRHSICSLALLSATSEDALVEALEDVSEMRMLVQAARLLRTLMYKRIRSKRRISRFLKFFAILVSLDDERIAGPTPVCLECWYY